MRFYNAVSRGKKGPLSLRHFPLIVLVFVFDFFLSLSCSATAIVAVFADPSSFLGFFPYNLQSVVRPHVGGWLTIIYLLDGNYKRFHLIPATKDVVQDLTRITRYSTETHAWFREWRNETGPMGGKLLDGSR